MGGLRGGSRIHKRGVLEMVAVGVLRCTIALVGSGGIPPRKFFDFRPSKIVSGAVSGQNSYQKLAISHRHNSWECGPLHKHGRLQPPQPLCFLCQWNGNTHTRTRTAKVQ